MKTKNRKVLTFVDNTDYNTIEQFEYGNFKMTKYVNLAWMYMLEYFNTSMMPNLLLIVIFKSNIKEANFLNYARLEHVSYRCWYDGSNIGEQTVKINASVYLRRFGTDNKLIE